MDDALIIRITDHAYAQYCQRVGEIDRTMLREHVGKVVNNGECHRSREFVQIDGVWWVFEIAADVMLLITCYGRTEFDIPRALRWAKVHNDRINLDGTR